MMATAIPAISIALDGAPTKKVSAAMIQEGRDVLRRALPADLSVSDELLEDIYTAMRRQRKRDKRNRY